MSSNCQYWFEFLPGWQNPEMVGNALILTDPFNNLHKFTTVMEWHQRHTELATHKRPRIESNRRRVPKSKQNGKVFGIRKNYTNLVGTNTQINWCCYLFINNYKLKAYWIELCRNDSENEVWERKSTLKKTHAYTINEKKSENFLRHEIMLMRLLSFFPVSVFFLFLKWQSHHVGHS